MARLNHHRTGVAMLNRGALVEHLPEGGEGFGDAGGVVDGDGG